MNSSSLNVLLVEDKNTFGMMDTGSNDSSSPFYRYMKTTGSSGGDQTRAGSHGLGKEAPLATSPMRTIFVATCWNDTSSKEGIKKLYQGRCRLMRRTKNGRIHSGVGFWGSEENYQPITELPSERFAWLERTSRGTTIAIPGFRSDAKKEWATVITGYVISGFLLPFNVAI